MLAASAAVSAWLSMGLVAVTGAGTAARVVALPPLWVLGALAALAIVAAVLVKPSARQLAPLGVTWLMWLPYVPGAIPSWFLIFEGPIEIGIWIVALIGLVPVGLPRSRVAQMRAHPGLAPVTAALIALLAYTAGAVALRDQLPIGDEPHYLMMTQSLIKDGDLRIENNHQNRDYASFSKFDIPMHYLTRGTDGQIYSVHAPGVSVLVLPAFALFGYYGGVATVMLCVALASALAWHAAWLLTGRVAAAWITWAAIFLTAPVYLQAITVFPDAVGALPVMAGVWVLIALEMRRPVSDRALLVVSLALAALPWLHSRFALLAGGIGLAIALRLLAHGWRRVALFLGAPAMSAALWFGFFWWFWGSPSPTAPWGSGITSRIEWIPRGLRGLLFDPQAGMLVPAPAYLCAFAGWLMMLRSRPRLAIETSAIAVVLAVSVASYDAWWGGQGAPARYLVAALPLCAAPIATFASHGYLAGRSAAFAALVSVLLLVPKVYAAGGAFAFNPETGVNPLFGWMSPMGSPISFVERSSSTDVTAAAARIDLTSASRIAPAVGTARLGDVAVFFMDAGAYPEPSGFWVQAEGGTTVLMDLADPSRHLGLRLQAGPVATTVDVVIGGERQTLSFTPRQRHEMAIPPAAVGAWKITIRPGAGFRPVDFDASAKDSRNLGVWVEVF